MSSWIFQADPKQFDIDGFLAGKPGLVTWLVNQYSDRVSIGDKVYLWRAGARQMEKAGVMAEADVISPVQMMPSDPQGAAFYTDPSQVNAPANRVWLRLIKCGSSRETLKREWLKEDPILHNILILRRASGTNFPLKDFEEKRLAQMWARVGQNWTRNESLAGLWAYMQTIGQPVSRLKDSAVAKASLHTGRAISAICNKITIFCSLDPRNERTGMTRVSDVDKKTWVDYFNLATGELDSARVAADFERVWKSSGEGKIADPDAEALKAAALREADELSEKSLAELLDVYKKQKAIASVESMPSVRAASTIVYERNPLVVAIAKVRADYRCEISDCRHALFQGRDGRPYCEVHHIRPLSDGGEDAIENVACLCPSHHREAHLGQDLVNIRNTLEELRSRK